MRKWLVFYFVALVMISHVVLPAFECRDFYIFSTWKLFAGTPRPYLYDISWDGGDTFLFRDRRDQMRKEKLNQPVLFYLAQNQSLPKIKELFLGKILKLCKCQKVQIAKMKSSLFDFFVLKNPATPVEWQDL